MRTNEAITRNYFNVLRLFPLTLSGLVVFFIFLITFFLWEYELSDNLAFVFPFILVIICLIEMGVLVRRNQLLTTRTEKTADALNNSEARLHALLNTMNDVFWSFDLTGKNENFVSASACRRYGMPLSTLLTHPFFWYDNVHKDDLPLKTRVKEQLALLGQAEYKYRVLDERMGERWFYNRERLIKDKNGKPVRIEGISVDVTYIKQTEKIIEDQILHLEQKINERTNELNNALAKEKAVADTKNKFVSIASHEFRTPLSTIQFAAGFVKCFHSRLSPDALVRKMGEIENQVRHMTCFLNDILTIEKTGSGKINVSKETINLIDFFEKIIVDVQHSTGDTHTVTKQFPASCVIQSDERFLRNIFGNLINNAIKFSPGKERVLISMEQREEVVWVSVTDYGIGIPQQDLDNNIFESFHRSENAKAIEGTGLGLTIVKKAVDLLKGEIRIASKIGEGSTFTIKIPVA